MDRLIEIEIEPWYMHELATSRGDEDTRSEVVLVLLRPRGKVLAISKAFYPPGTFRLPTGGIRPGETPQEAFLREVDEETGLSSEPIRTIDTMVLRCKSGSESLDITSYVILGSPTSAPPEPNDLQEKITGYEEIDPAGLREVGERLSNLQGRWRSWGLFRAPAHFVVADFLLREASGDET
ncbi:MAG: NUDIX domain-containing protein [Armatimonadota bacterium]